MIQIRRFKRLEWGELVKVRDGLQIAKDNLTASLRDWDYLDNLLAEVSDEIDIRYKKEVANNGICRWNLGSKS